ncbi:30S ribosomal protein S7 [Candidatus Poribacteria bacterium]|nr:30S ribosomal protein S7 [Candidatus Poribacteria bacterium]
MPRRRAVIKREPIPDPVYGSPTIQKFINSIMRDGKKSVAENIVYRSMRIVEERTSQDPLDIFQQALENVRPVVEVKSRRVGGQTYQVPVEVRAERRTSLAFRWLIQYARARGEKSMEAKLAGELMDAARNEGNAVRRKLDTHRMADANKAFSHYKW